MNQIVWFRSDLRMRDHAALHAAANQGPVLPVFILEDGADVRKLGGASQWWLHHSLQQLKTQLGTLVFLKGNPTELLPQLAKQVGASAVHWNDRYDPSGQHMDRQVQKALENSHIDVVRHFSGLLVQPGQLLNKSGAAFKVFTPFWKKLKDVSSPKPLRIPEIDLFRCQDIGFSLEELNLLPEERSWAQDWHLSWSPGERGAAHRLETFIRDDLLGYGEGRDRPDQYYVSRLSPHLHFRGDQPSTDMGLRHIRHGEGRETGRRWMEILVGNWLARILLSSAPPFSTDLDGKLETGIQSLSLAGKP